MKDLIEALTIALKYGNPPFPTHCEHDVMYLMLDPSEVSSEDKDRLGELGFHEDDSDESTFYSYLYGSA